MGGTDSADDCVGERYKEPRYTGFAAESFPIFEVNVAGVCDDRHKIKKIAAAHVEKNYVFRMTLRRYIVSRQKAIAVRS